MNSADTAIQKLAWMVDDIDNHQLFQANGPLSWFSLKKTFVAAAKKAALSAKQCKLAEKVYAEYKDLKRAAREFCGSDECRRLAHVLQELQKTKPRAVATEERSRSQRLSRIVHALFGHRAIHVGDFADAERLVAELAHSSTTELWEVIHSARRRYLAALYRQTPEAGPSGNDATG
jgi:hypothetical protein